MYQKSCVQNGTFNAEQDLNLFRQVNSVNAVFSLMVLPITNVDIREIYEKQKSI